MVSEKPALLSSIWHDPNYVLGEWVVLTNAGVLISIGTRLANGCSSGRDVCGITPYSESHIGHAMSAVIFDTLRRYLLSQNYKKRASRVSSKPGTG